MSLLRSIQLIFHKKHCVALATIAAFSAGLVLIGAQSAPAQAPASPKLAELMGTDLFIYHGYVALWLNGRMFKVTPAFNTELCERFGVRQLIFDGQSDALFHEFDTRDHRHMEYVNDRGWFADPPIARLLRDFRVAYPKLVAMNDASRSVNDAAFGGG